MFQQVRRAGVLAGLALVLLASLVHAQATATIHGTVTDAQGAVVPGAQVALLNRDTRQGWVAISDARGEYRFAGLAAGRYRLTAMLAGFADRVIDRIVVAAGAVIRVDCLIEVAALSHVDWVSRDPPRIETSATSYGLVIPERDLVELPLNGRNFTQLGTLMPGVTAPPAALGGQVGDATPGGFGNVTGGFNVNGMRNQSNNFLLDGMPNNDTFNTGFVLRPPPDAIDEFRIFTHAYSAERGRNAGSVVSVTTRAGGGLWRASAWEFNRDDALEARNRFAVEKPALGQHQFGATAGGAPWRNRVFAFGYYEGYRNTRGTTDTRTVLSAAQRGGDFSGAAPITDPLTGRPFEGNRIPASRLDPTAASLLATYVPLPNQPGHRFTHAPDVVDRRHQLGGRVDVNVASSHRLMGRVLAAHTEQLNPLGPANFSPAGNRATARLADALVTESWVLGPRWVNEARASIDTIDAHPTTTSGLDPRAAGFAITPSNPAALGLPNIGVNGYFTLGDAQQPFASRTNRVVTMADDLTWIPGDGHSLKAGFEIRQDHVGLAFINRPNGNFTFNGQYTGNAAADFLLGLPQQYRQAAGDPEMDGHTWTTSLYAQGEWRVRSDLSVSAGVRYERAAPFVERDDKLNAFHPGQQSTRFPQAPLGLVYPGDAGVPRGTYPTDANNVAPRLAVAWNVPGSSGTVVRAAWGLFYDTIAAQGDFFQNGTLAPPFQPLTEVNYAPTSPTPRFQAPLAGVGGAADFPPGLIFIGWGPSFETPVVQHSHLSLQHDLLDTVGLELAYAGSRATHLPIFMEVNPTTPILSGSPRPGPRLYPAFSLVRPTFSEARSSYDALQASARVRGWNGLTALASYTWGHAIDHVSGLNIGGEPRPMLPVTIGDQASVERALAREKGDALFDVRHRFVLSAAYRLPDLDERGALLRHVFGRWQINAIVQAQTGFALTVTEPVDVALQSLTNRPDVTCDPNAGAPRTIDQWFDTRCFTQLTRAANAGEIGDAGRGIVRGPGFARTDLSLIKRIGLPREQTIELRVEAFNLFDQARYGNPGLSIGTPGFGKITSADDGRIVQLGVKWGWR